MVENELPKVNYDEIAATYDQRYIRGEPPGLAQVLFGLVNEVGASRILEAGCGTGHWLATLYQSGDWVCGLDLSFGMLRKARRQASNPDVVQASASRLPFVRNSFDLVFCVNALHHFDDPAGFIQMARGLLRPGGALAVIGMNPHAGRDRWYVYDYFPGTLEMDLKRYPSAGTLTDWMVGARFERVTWQAPVRIARQWHGRDVLADPSLQKNGTSQLILLSDAAYAAGMARIEGALARAEQAGEQIVFPAEVTLGMVVGWRE